MDQDLDDWVAETAEVTIKRLQARRVETAIPAGMAAGECHFSATGFALWHLNADGSHHCCSCRPCAAPPQPEAHQ